MHYDPVVAAFLVFGWACVAGDIYLHRRRRILFAGKPQRDCDRTEESTEVRPSNILLESTEQVILPLPPAIASVSPTQSRRAATTGGDVKILHALERTA